MVYQARVIIPQADKSLEAHTDFQGFIGTSPAITAIYKMLQNAAPSNATVFIKGESGTGKELCAEALHALSSRKDKPFIALNCGAIARDILESELFGHVKGAYTGAHSDRKGAIMQAQGGTLFLDEICEMDLSLQVKLLRFLQARQVQRVGEDTPRAVDVRIVCATNRDPATQVEQGLFREDLFYRLHVVPINLPPLRARGDDILTIATHFLNVFSMEDNKQFTGFSAQAEQALLTYDWPGNIRQLQNIVRNIVVMQSDPIIGFEALPDAIQQFSCMAGADMLSQELENMMYDARTYPGMIEPLDMVIRRVIEDAISRFDGNIPRAAAALEVAPSTIYRKMQVWQRDEHEMPHYGLMQ
jgi:two-component system, repressor protein LuxO